MKLKEEPLKKELDAAFENEAQSRVICKIFADLNARLLPLEPEEPSEEESKEAWEEQVKQQKAENEAAGLNEPIDEDNPEGVDRRHVEPKSSKKHK